MNKEFNIRKNSLMYHHGIGGLWTDNSDNTYIIKTPKYWNWKGDGRSVINEENLRRFLGVSKILFPPGAKDKQIEFVDGDIGIGRFPGWHRCKGFTKLRDDNGNDIINQNGKPKYERCGLMVKLSQPTETLPYCSDPSCTGAFQKGKKFPSKLAPVRFMQICSKGHLDDFPFHYWVHKDKNHENHQLKYVETSAGGLRGINIICVTCSSKKNIVKRNMSGALSPENFSPEDCTGYSPWIDKHTENCDCDKLVGVQKSSSNILFPIIYNSIFSPSDDQLPDWIKNFIDKDRSTIISCLKNMDLKTTLETFSGHYPDEKQHELISRIEEVELYLNPKAKNDPFDANGYKGIFQREYNRLINFPESQKLDDFTIVRPDINQYSSDFKKVFRSVGLVEKLRDTRVYLGFNRIDDENERPSLEVIDFCYGENHVVGDIIRGEGIFLEFSPDQINKWSENEDVKRRFGLILSEQITSDNRKFPLIDGDSKKAMEYMLIHSLSHALIAEISSYTGYNTASTRERIYIGEDGLGGQMYGLLIYTSDGDSEGSLGGLVRVGKAGVLEGLMQQAVKRASWCSSDPLCSHSIPKGTSGCNLAACHHCLLLPETSCECGNQFLDREFIISINNPNLGFLKHTI